MGRENARWLLCLLAIFVLAACGGNGQDSHHLKVGDQAPDFTATALDGRSVDLAAHKGQPAVIRFFSPDCKYCKADTKVFNEYYEAYRDKGLLLVYIDTEADREAAAAFVKELNIRFPLIVDADRALATRYQVRVVPQTIVLSPEHRIVCAFMGGVSKEQLDEIIAGYYR